MSTRCRKRLDRVPMTTKKLLIPWHRALHRPTLRIRGPIPKSSTPQLVHSHTNQIKTSFLLRTQHGRLVRNAAVTVIQNKQLVRVSTILPTRTRLKDSRSLPKDKDPEVGQETLVLAQEVMTLKQLISRQNHAFQRLKLEVKKRKNETQALMTLVQEHMVTRNLSSVKTFQPSPQLSKESQAKDCLDQTTIQQQDNTTQPEQNQQLVQECPTALLLRTR